MLPEKSIFRCIEFWGQGYVAKLNLWNRSTVRLPSHPSEFFKEKDRRPTDNKQNI